MNNPVRWRVKHSAMISDTALAYLPAAHAQDHAQSADPAAQSEADRTEARGANQEILATGSRPIDSNVSLSSRIRTIKEEAFDICAATGTVDLVNTLLSVGVRNTVSGTYQAAGRFLFAGVNPRF